MKVLLLAAGKSKRIKPIENKVLLKFFGRELIVHFVEDLKVAGFNDIVVVCGQDSIEQIKSCLSDKFDEVKISYCIQEKPEEGMAGAMRSAKDLIRGEEILIVSTNDLIERKAYKMIADGIKNAEDGLLLAKKVESYFPGGYLTIKNGLIEGIIEKPGAGNEPSDLVNLVFHYHKNADLLIEALQKIETTSDDIYELALDNLFKSGKKYLALEYKGKWQPIKFPWHVCDAFLMGFERELEIRGENLISDKSTLAESAVIKGKVIIEEGVKILENAVVSGPAYLGRNCLIANNALVRESHLGDGCVAGYTTEIARSFLEEKVWTHSNYIGDSIIGSDVSFGAGTITGNLRLDEKEIEVEINSLGKVKSGRNKLGIITGNRIRCGINTNFMPGVKVGSDSFIGAGVNVANDLAEKSFVYLKQEVVVKENMATVNANSREEMKKKL